LALELQSKTDENKHKIVIRRTTIVNGLRMAEQNIAIHLYLSEIFSFKRETIVTQLLCYCLSTGPDLTSVKSCVICKRLLEGINELESHLSTHTFNLATIGGFVATRLNVFTKT
jgi:predicted dithiol-disulfide oxidoreductase (DUF899 family)